ncbi:MAG: thiamine pyrophosphate-dependent enzyme [Candidatus Limnocylindrales bacterium]
MARSRTVGHLLARALADAGVEWAFTVPGESFLGVLDALPGAGIKVVATRHEGGAAFMAEAVGQLTTRPAAVLGTRAVGAGNMAIGIHTAKQNSTPLVALVGQVKREFLGREAFQEVDQVESFGRLAKWAAQIDDPDTAADVISEGLRIMMSGRPGPILLSLPEEVLDLPARSRGRSAQKSEDGTTAAAVDAGAVRSVVERLLSAKRPAVIAGGGVIAATAKDLLVDLSERLAVPVFNAWRRPSAFPNDHANYLGMTGYGSPASVLKYLKAADFVLVIGCRLNEVASFDYEIPTRRQKWAHVDLEPRVTHAGLDAPDIGIAADARAFLAAALDVVPKSAAVTEERRATLARERQLYLDATTFVEDAEWRGPGVNPGHVIATLERVIPSNTILTTDAGNFGNWPARFFHFGREHDYLGPTSGAMGYGLPAAIAASLCEPKRTVVAICGDGGFAMTMNEMETAVRTGAKPIVLVFDNQRYGTIAMHQRNSGRDLVATELGPFDFAAVARAAGAQGGRVTRDAEFEPALRDALAANRPAVIHLEMDKRWISPDKFEA